MVCTHGGADHIRLGMWRDVSPSVKPFGLATSLVRGRLFSLAPLCKGGCQPFRLTEGLFLRLADTDNPSGASRHLPLHKGGKGVSAPLKGELAAVRLTEGFSLGAPSPSRRG